MCLDLSQKLYKRCVTGFSKKHIGPLLSLGLRWEILARPPRSPRVDFLLQKCTRRRRYGVVRVFLRAQIKERN